MLAISASGQTSVYHPFPDSNAIWREHYSNAYTGQIHYQYGIFGDTLLKSLKYHKVYYQPNCLTDTLMTTSNSLLIGGIREDSAKRVFYYSFNYRPDGAGFIHDDSIYKLYDFSLQIGDTVKFESSLYNLEYNRPFLVLDGIDSVFVYDHFRKRFYLQGEIWIEGIGSERSLFSSIIPQPTCMCNWNSVCFEFDNKTYYLNPLYSDCYDMSYGIESNKLTVGNINVFPNPSNGSFTVDFGNLENIREIRILDLLGKIVFQQSINKQSKINIDKLPSGVYILTVIDNENKMTNKKIISSP
jgi:hypothetical protein